MTEDQRKKLSLIIDLNWDFVIEKDVLRKIEMGRDLEQLKNELRDDMGQEDYDIFMQRGRQMFSPKITKE
jgi:hypothetical protein